MTWSKSQFTNLKTEPRSVNISTLSNELQHEFRAAFRQKDLHAKMEVASSLKAYVDPNHLEIILRNLIQNAIKFSNTGGSISLVAENVDEHISIAIIDEGKGMNKEQISNLFDINTHFSTPGTLNEKGTGLGMIIINDFVRENNGSIEVESEPNKGSSFKILLPIE